MNTYQLGIYIRLIDGTIALHTYRIQVEKSLAWVKQHADELAGKILTGIVKTYCALHVLPA